MIGGTPAEGLQRAMRAPHEMQDVIEMLVSEHMQAEEGVGAMPRVAWN